MSEMDTLVTDLKLLSLISKSLKGGQRKKMRFIINIRGPKTFCRNPLDLTVTINL